MVLQQGERKARDHRGLGLAFGFISKKGLIEGEPSLLDDRSPVRVAKVFRDDPCAARGGHEGIASDGADAGV